jgi:hypothetical protein
MTNDYYDPNRKGGSIQTFSGVIFYPLDPRVEDINLVDIAHATSHKARFTGHTRKFYSSCEHQVRVSRYLASIGASIMDQFIGLHHDDSDAYLPDVPTPLKILPEFQWFREIEHNVQSLCYEKFGCKITDYSPIKNADKVLLLTEKRDLMPTKNGDWQRKFSQSPIPPPYYIQPWSPSVAKTQYLELHNILSYELLQNHSTT